ncbi:hypothetical protein R3Q06_33685 [Rhodococcus erythropolis]|uniref:hypothetical protein n=1 Tax=Rhodococcus erythropolis TaxID=1833 RepID=UPI0029491864|nr:hypothetical protein [Rhodococcus erythropolis]MDV6278384.1 hypothetical protein [Rhodococcus erythropolis]
MESCPDLEPQDCPTDLSDVIGNAHHALSNSMHREQIPLQCVERIFDDNKIILPALPTVWTIDKDLLPKHVRTKISARTAAGLPNPIHADGASEIVAENARPGKKSASKNATSTPLQDGAELSGRQKRALHKQLTFDVPGAPIEVSQGPLGKALACLETRRNRSDGTINIAPLAMLVLSVPIFALGGYVPGLVALVSTVSLIWWANHKKKKSIELVSEDYRAMEVATVPMDLSDTNASEHRIVQLAYALRQEIDGKEIWSSDLMRDQMRPDTENEIYRISKQAAAISEIRRKTHSTTWRQDADSDGIMKCIQLSMWELVAALFRYAVELSELDSKFTVLQGTLRASEHDLDLRNLLYDVGIDEISTVNTLISTDALRYKSEMISAQIEILNGNISMGNPISGSLGDGLA